MRAAPKTQEPPDMRRAPEKHAALESAALDERLVPDADTYARAHRPGLSLPIVLECEDPGWDPLSLAAALPESTNLYLLESAGGPADLERRTFLAWDPECEFVLRHGRLETRGEFAVRRSGVRAPAAGVECGAPLQTLREKLGAAGAVSVPWGDGFNGGLVGYVAYDFKNHLERLPDRVRDDLGTPELRLGLVRRVVSWDHIERKLQLRVNLHCHSSRARTDRMRALAALEELRDEVLRLRTAAAAARLVQRTAPSLAGRERAGRQRRSGPAGRLSASAPRSNLERAAYDVMLARAFEYIRAGDIYQANLSHRFEAPFAGSGLELYRRLREINPSPFATYMRFPEHELVSCSPERLVRLQRGRVETRPIAGTRPRGATTHRDRSLERELLASEKERAEHLMIVDMARNDIGRVCELGSVAVERFMSVERYSHVRHLVSTVAGRLRAERDAFDLLAATFPGASITGVPKIRCMQIIDELEAVRRGVYTGSAGYIGLDGNLDLNILIRTFFLQDGRAWFHVGGGIVADSDPTSEYRETLAKARALHEALLGRSRPRATRGVAVWDAART